MATFTWTITQMDCHPQLEGNANVVFIVHWTCFGADGAYNASIYSTCNVPASTNAFTPYTDLTQDQVLGWIWANGVDKTSVETTVEQQIQSQIDPIIIRLDLPWATI